MNKSKTLSVALALSVLMIAAGVLFWRHGASNSGVWAAVSPSDSQEEGGASPDAQLEGMKIVHRFPEIVPYGEGELLTFAIQYGLIYAGDATLEVRNVASIDSARAYHIVSTARTNSASCPLSAQ